MDQLADALLALAGTHFAVEILVGDHVRGQLAPRRGDFAVLLLEKHLAALAFDGGRAQVPFDRGKRIRAVIGTEQGGYAEPSKGVFVRFLCRVIGHRNRVPVVSHSGLSMRRFLIPLGLCSGILPTIYCISCQSGHNIQSRSSKSNDFFIRVNRACNDRLKSLWHGKLRNIPPL